MRSHSVFKCGSDGRTRIVAITPQSLSSFCGLMLQGRTACFFDPRTSAGSPWPSYQNDHARRWDGTLPANLPPFLQYGTLSWRSPIMAFREQRGQYTSGHSAPRDTIPSTRIVTAQWRALDVQLLSSSVGQAAGGTANAANEQRPFYYLEASLSLFGPSTSSTVIAHSPTPPPHHRRHL